MAFEFKLPDIGEGLTEGEVVKWLVKEGDVVKDDQPMVEVMTDKATVEITAPRAGTIAKIHAAEGETVPVGSVMVVIDDGGARAGRERGGRQAGSQAGSGARREAGRGDTGRGPRRTDAGPGGPGGPGAGRGRPLARAHARRARHAKARP